MKYRSHLIPFVITLCLLLSACTNPNGPSVYLINEPWEMNGNAITVTETSAVKDFLTPSEDVLEPGDGCLFLLVRCSTNLKQSVSISSKTNVTLAGNASSEPYILFTAPISEGNNSYVFLFSIEESAYTKEISDYRLTIHLVESSFTIATPEFWLTENP